MNDSNLQALSKALTDARVALGRARAAAGLPVSDGNSGLETAERLLSDRRMRGRVLPAELFGEPAWDLLLVLFIAHEQGREIGISAAYREAGLADATGFRWADSLAAAGLVARHPSPRKRSAGLLRLTERGAEKMRGLLSRTG